MDITITNCTTAATGITQVDFRCAHGTGQGGWVADPPGVPAIGTPWHVTLDTAEVFTERTINPAETACGLALDPRGTLITGRAFSDEGAAGTIRLEVGDGLTLEVLCRGTDRFSGETVALLARELRIRPVHA